MLFGAVHPFFHQRTNYASTSQWCFQVSHTRLLSGTPTLVTYAILKLSKRACKWILGDYDSSYTDMLWRLNLLPLSYFIEITDLLFLSKVINGVYDTDWTGFFTFHENQRSTRHSSTFDLQRTRNVKTTERFFHRTPQLANNIPIDICIMEGLKRGCSTTTGTYSGLLIMNLIRVHGRPNVSVQNTVNYDSVSVILLVL